VNARSIGRDHTVDFLRGAAMILMALDHVRYYFSSPFIDPLDLTLTSPSLFLTRWVTHFCAPIFVFLAGLGIALSLQKSRNKPEMTRFLLTRGFLLIVFELTIIQWSWDFSFDYSHATTALVIWAIGWSMICLAGLIYIPKAIVGALAVFMIFGHNSLDMIRVTAESHSLAGLWMILHQVGSFPLSSSIQFSVLYPLIPWVGVMALGFVCGELYTLFESERRSYFRYMGLGCLALFVVLRSLNIYGDAMPWSPQKDFVYTALSFINCTKYPPSLLYLLMTLGPALLLLGELSLQRPNLVASFLSTLGRVPMFFYLIHIPLIHSMSIVLASWNFHQTDFLFFMIDTFKTKLPTSYGYSLSSIYFIWFFCIALLVYPCLWFAKIKGTKKYIWLRYL
jgi:uncharacterized membrane protein